MSYYPYTSSYNSPYTVYTGNTTNYTGSTSYPPAYTCTAGNIAYDTYTSNATFANNTIQLQTSTSLSPGSYYITGAANNAWNGNYTIGQDIGGAYTIPTVYWQATYPTVDISPPIKGLDISTPEATTIPSHDANWIAAILFDLCSECLGTGRIPSNTVEPTCSHCNGTGKGAIRASSNG
jgi:hypothetical protein